MAVPTLTVGTNTYITRTEATDFIDSRLFGDNWDSATDDEKDQALLQSLRVLDEFFEWKGTPTSYELTTQPLSWPRYGVTDRDGRLFPSNEVPDAIKEAQAELANFLLGEDFTELSTSDGEVSEVAAGPVKVKFNNSRGSTSAAAGLIPEYFVAKLANYGEPIDEAGNSGGGTVRLARG